MVSLENQIFTGLPNRTLVSPGSLRQWFHIGHTGHTFLLQRQCQLSLGYSEACPSCPEPSQSLSWVHPVIVDFHGHLRHAMPKAELTIFPSTVCPALAVALTYSFLQHQSYNPRSSGLSTGPSLSTMVLPLPGAPMSPDNTLQSPTSLILSHLLAHSFLCTALARKLETSSHRPLLAALRIWMLILYKVVQTAPE